MNNTVRQFPTRPAPVPAPDHAGDHPFLVVATVVLTAVRREDVGNDLDTAGTVAAATVGDTLRAATNRDGELPTDPQAVRVVLLKTTTTTAAVTDGHLTVQAAQVMP